ncbi:MAG: LD-carboxypeptidase [Halanaerobiales bacterium]
MIKYPAPLEKGDVIGVTAPSSGVQGVFSSKLDNAINKFEELGYKVIETESVRKQKKLVSASPQIRAEEFIELYNNQDVKAIIPPWGGEFLMEILPYLNFEDLKKSEPKWILGFSDISTLLFTFTLKTNIATVHGPNFLDFGNNQVHNSVLNVLDILNKKSGETFKQKSLDQYQEEWLEVTEDNFPSYNLTEEVSWKYINYNNNFSGRLIGGNMDVLCKLIGTEYGIVSDFLKQYNEVGIVWYFESCEMDATDIHRTFWQMKMNGWFKNCNGLLFGRVAGYNNVQDYSYVDALENMSNDLNIPIIYDIDLGHKPPQLTFINGAYAEIKISDDKEEIIQTLKQ